MDQAPASKKLKLVDAELYQSSFNPADLLDYLNILPNEVLEIIFSSLRPKFLHQNVLPVCKRFRTILTDNKVWMRKIRDYHLKVSLCDAELENADFSPVRPIHVTLAHPVEGVNIFERSGHKYCLSASGEYVNYRNHNQYIQLWDLDAVTFASPLIHEVTFRSSENFGEFEMCGTERFLSGTHDGTLKLWDIGEAGFREIKHSVGLPITGEVSYIKSVKLKGTTIYILFTDQLMTLDVRNLSVGPVHRHVFDLPFMSGFFQRDSRHQYKRMSVADGLIHCCHNGGKISVWQASDLAPCYSFYVSENHLERMRLSSVVKTKGSVLALTGQSVKAFSLGSQPECIGVADYSGCDSVLDVLHEDVLVGSDNGELTYWPTDNHQ